MRGGQYDRGGLESFSALRALSEKLALLKPAHIAEIPQPVAETNSSTRVSPISRMLVLATGVQRRAETSTNAPRRSVAYREYEDSDALRSYRKNS